MIDFKGSQFEKAIILWGVPKRFRRSRYHLINVGREAAIQTCCDKNIAEGGSPVGQFPAGSPAHYRLAKSPAQW